jgi:spermidine synthase
MKERLKEPVLDNIKLWVTKYNNQIIYSVKDVEFQKSEYYIEWWHIKRYTREELELLDWKN